MNIGIVTSFYNGYDRFLPQWLNSIYRLKTMPSQLTIVASGQEYDVENIHKALKILKKINIPYKIIYLKKHMGMGFARNKAVENTNTEWIQYLDVDDIILPDAINIYNKYKDETDIICGGLDIKGDKKNKKALYPYASRERQLQGKHCTSSHGVYKRKFWELSPYVNNDWCEQILWLGFAQHGAEFMGTKELCTVYLTRKDGHNLNMTKKDWELVKAQREFFVKEGVKHDEATLFQSTNR